MSGAGYALGLHCGITFAGIKAASLFWLKDEDSGNINYYRACFAKKRFRFIVVKRAQGKKLYYVFNEEKLEDILADGENRLFLASLGYNCCNIESVLRRLKARLSATGDFPHEVGLFLGYPLDDVKGFIADAKGGENIGGYWKVYSRPQEKARLFARYDDCTRCICRKLESGTPIEQIFKVV
ncbi:MAG: DUF3793 family protein [Clostridia bacterium]|nr:DUF3793 family protein [Clostridia bacterium]